MQVRVVDVPWADPRAAALRAEMDVEMSARYGDPISPAAGNPFFIDPDDIAVTVLAVADDDTAVGHGALRRLGAEWEVKRVIVGGDHRGHGVSYAVMERLEDAARQRGAARVILHTGERQPEAIHVYERLGYAPIPVYPPYQDLALSRCFAKVLAP